MLQFYWSDAVCGSHVSSYSIGIHAFLGVSWGYGVVMDGMVVSVWGICCMVYCQVSVCTPYSWQISGVCTGQVPSVCGIHLRLKGCTGVAQEYSRYCTVGTVMDTVLV